MSFPRYPAYKDSGVEWLGEVPSHWSIVPLKRDMAFLTSGSRGWAEHYSDEGAIFIRIGNLTREGIDLDLADIQRVSVPEGSEGERTKLEPGDILFSITAYLGSVAVVPENMEPCFVSQHIALARLHQNKFSPKWVAYIALSIVGKTYLAMMGYGGTKIQLGLNDIANLLVTAPPVPEQYLITQFLDRETAKIDALIAEQERLIALLAEKRQAVISHAVTQGLDPSAPMKDSGVEWLGEVPGHWDVAPLKYLVHLQSGGTPSKDRLEYWDGNIPWASAKDMKMEYLRDTEDHLSEVAIEERAATLLEENTVVVVVRGMILARAFPVALTLTRLAINQDLKAVRAGQRLFPSFLAWYLRGTAAESLHRLDEAGHGTKALRMDAWTSFTIVVPPYQDQRDIAAHLDDQTTRLDTLTTKAQHAITLLKERRTALISAAVTGKIDVRGLVPQESA